MRQSAALQSLLQQAPCLLDRHARRLAGRVGLEAQLRTFQLHCAVLQHIRAARCTAVLSGCTGQAAGSMLGAATLADRKPAHRLWCPLHLTGPPQGLTWSRIWRRCSASAASRRRLRCSGGRSAAGTACSPVPPPPCCDAGCSGCGLPSMMA